MSKENAIRLEFSIYMMALFLPEIQEIAMAQELGIADQFWL